MLFSVDQLNHAMRQAAAEGRKWLGATSPNPAVGAAALNAEGHIIAIAAHHRAGAAHAEALLIETCRERGLLDKIHTLCITLEPCNHQGRTPPCTDAIIAAGIRNVAIGTRDPNHHVTGGGIERLKSAGIEIATGVAEEECRQLIHAFAFHEKTGKPWVMVKRAFNHNGSMIPPVGQKTFTSPESLCLAHRLRKKADAIVTGSGTILADNPLYTVRHVPDHAGKQRWLAILDRRGRVPSEYIAAAKTRGLKPIIYADIHEAFGDLAAKGAQDIMVEAGPALSQSVLDSGLWAMSVTVRQGDQEAVDVQFNPALPLPFLPQEFQWEHFLPQENL